jgi:glycosyltransferase involved in cell wall biosynthesis
MEPSIQQQFKDRKVCVVIPTYNNATTLRQVIQSVLSYTDQVIVVNDGSTDSTLSIAVEFPEVEIVSYSVNQGKGIALQKGFRHALQSGYSYAITIDSDGQHYAEDLPIFLTMLEAHPNAIIIGARNMDQASVPGKSSFGNKFSNFWFWVETGIRRNDTQSGYRLYPVKAMETMRFFTRKFEFEIEVIVRGAWRGIEVLEAPVKVFYPAKEKRISHFRPFRDFSRISVLNTVLVAIAFLYIKPRDLFRSIKKKTSVRSSVTSSSIRWNPIRQRQCPLALVFSWE